MAARTRIRGGECGMSVWVFQSETIYPTIDDVPNPTSTGTIPEWTAPYPIQAWMLEHDTEYPTSRHVQNPTATGRLSEMEAPNPTWMWHLFSGYAYPYLEKVENVDTSFPSARYKREIVKPSRHTKLTGTLTTTAGTVIELESSDIVSGSLSISSDAMPDGDFFLAGGVPMAEMTVSLFRSVSEVYLYDGIISFSFWLWLPEDENGASAEWYEVPLGSFHIVEALNGSEETLSITGNDDMLLLGRTPFSALNFAEGQYYTPAEIIMICCDVSGVMLGTSLKAISEMPNGTEQFAVSAVDSSVETARDLLGYVCQIIGCFAFIDRFGKMQIKRLAAGEASAAIPIQMRTSSTFSAIPYGTGSLSMRVSKNEDNTEKTLYLENHRLTPAYFPTVSHEIATNPLFAVLLYPFPMTWTLACQAVFNAMTSDYFDVQYMACEMETVGDPAIGLGDWVTTQRTERSGGLAIPMTAYTYSYRGPHTVTAAGREAIAGVLRSRSEKTLQAKFDNQTDFMDGLYEQLYEIVLAQNIPFPIASKTGEWLITTTGEYLQYNYSEEE